MQIVGASQLGRHNSRSRPQRLPCQCPMPGRFCECQAGVVSILFPPHCEQTIRCPTFGTNASAGRLSFTTSAFWRHARQVAITACTPFSRMLPSVMGIGFSRAKTIVKRSARSGRPRRPG